MATTMIHMRNPILTSHMEYELQYLLGEDSEYLLDWYPLYFDNHVSVPPPLSHSLSKPEKHHRLSLLVRALSNHSSSQPISIGSVMNDYLRVTLWYTVWYMVLFWLAFLLWKRKSSLWMLVLIFILI